MELLYSIGYVDSGLITTLHETDELLGLFRGVADEQGWQPGDYLAASPPNALHLATWNHGILAGGMQMVLPNAAGCFPYAAVWPEVVLADAAHLVHITILALKAEFRGKPELFWPLCVEMWRYALAHDIKGIVMEATPPMLALYRRIGWPLEVVGDLRRHWGEDCYLCRMDTLMFAGSLLAKARYSDRYRSFVVQAYRSDQAAHCAPGATLP